MSSKQRREAPPRESGNLPASWQPQALARDLRAAARQEAHSRGAAAAASGLSRDTNPHAEGSALYVSWNAGWKGGGAS